MQRRKLQLQEQQELMENGHMPVRMWHVMALEAQHVQVGQVVRGLGHAGLVLAGDGVMGIHSPFFQRHSDGAQGVGV